VLSHAKTVREDNIQFIIESIGDKSFENYLGLKDKMLDFLNFTITKGVVIRSFKGFIDQGPVSIPTKILFHTYITEEMNKPVPKLQPLFRYSLLAHNPEFYLNNWFRLYKEIKVIMDLFFGVMYNTKSYLSSDFLMVFTAIEAYHHAVMDPSSRRKEKKVIVGDIILKKVEEYSFSNDEREKLRQLIKIFGKELSSKERLEEIYDQFDDILPSLSKIETRNKFIRKIVDIRNALSHGNVHPDSINQNNELFLQSRNLQIILQLCILSQLGFGNENIKQIYHLDKMTREKNR
jgi:hypothetical protein